MLGGHVFYPVYAYYLIIVSRDGLLKVSRCNICFRQSNPHRRPAELLSRVLAAVGTRSLGGQERCVMMGATRGRVNEFDSAIIEFREFLVTILFVSGRRFSRFVRTRADLVNNRRSAGRIRT